MKFTKRAARPIILGMVLFSCLYWSCGESSNPHAKVGQQDSLVTDSSMKLFNQAFNAPDTTDSYKIGSTVNFGTFSYKVYGCGYNKTLRISEDTEKKAEGIYLVILLDYTNMSHQTQVINGAEFTLADRDGNVYITSTDGMKALALGNNKIVDSKECPPKVHKIGYLCFEVPRKDIYYLLVPSKNGMGLKASIKLPER